mmetsp:Transcript_20265/g.27410  ORF Transcript_20265/g.27410 Transcript_20265/m.27410 type:complete len:96 (+) Transcript_20265:619-906(+)
MIPIKIEVGDSIPCIDFGLMNMRKGSGVAIFCPYHMAYGREAVGSLPAYSNLIFRIEVLEFEVGNRSKYTEFKSRIEDFEKKEQYEDDQARIEKE